MNDQSLSGAFSQFLPDANKTGAAGEDDMLVTSLKSAAGLSGGELAQAVNEFLGGEGELHATTRAAVTKGGTSTIKDLATLLTKQFKLSGPVAELVAGLLVKLLPKTEKEAAKKKPRKTKPKPKPTTTAKTAKEKKKPKPKTTAGAKKPKPKPKTAAKPKKKAGEF